MMKVDISNVWGCVEFGDLMSIEKEVAAAHAALSDGSGAGKEYLGWMKLPTREATAELTRIQAAAEKIRAMRLLQDGREIPLSVSWVHSDYPDMAFADLGLDPVLPDGDDTVLKVLLEEA